VREGPALDTLKTLSGPFDLIFIAADKDNYEAAIVAFNEHVRTDPRVSHVLLAARDGVLLVRRR